MEMGYASRLAGLDIGDSLGWIWDMRFVLIVILLLILISADYLKEVGYVVSGREKAAADLTAAALHEVEA